MYCLSGMLCALLPSQSLQAVTRTGNAAASSLAGSGIGDSSLRLDSEQQASLASLCAAWQETQPQLASLTQAALRLGSHGEARCMLHDAAAAFLQQLCTPGLFVEGGLQPGSPALKPLSGLVFTLLKLVKPLPGDHAVEATKCLSLVMRFNSLVLQAACATSRADSASVILNMLSHSKAAAGKWDAAQLSIISSIGSSTDCSSNNSGSGGGEGDAVALLPWLVSLGRCCQQFSGYAIVLQEGQADTKWQAVAQQSQGALGAMGQALQEVAAVLPAWLQSSSVSAQLAAAGYNTPRVTELLQSTVQAGQDAHAGAVVPPELLQKLGQALSNMPVGTACNNTRCTSLEGLSEQQLVVGRARLCAGCRVARYCSRDCQVAAWKQHKPACKAVASARAAKAAEDAA